MLYNLERRFSFLFVDKHLRQGEQYMEICELENKIPEVEAIARVVVQQYGHTKKFAKHLVAFAIKQILRLTDRELAEFVRTNKIGRILGYGKTLNPSTFSKVRGRSKPEMMKELYDAIIQQRYKGKQLRLVAQDSTDIPAHSIKDRHARVGHRTPSKREQEEAKGKANEFFTGYKLHAIADAENEVPIAFFITPANVFEKRTFGRLFKELKEKVTLCFGAKYLADSAFDSTDVRSQLHYDNIKDVIAINGRRYRKSQTPKDPDYGKRWSIERIFSRLKEVFGLSKNRFVGMKKVAIHTYSCLVAYLIKYVM